jgi:hypothetical protein
MREGRDEWGTRHPARHIRLIVWRMTPEKLDAVRANIFYAAHPAIEPTDRFRWHLGRDKVCDTDRPHSSQALAIDYFGTLKAADQLSRDIILAEIASEIGLPFEGPGRLSLSGRIRRTYLKRKVNRRKWMLLRAARKLSSFSSANSRREEAAAHRQRKQRTASYNAMAAIACREIQSIKHQASVPCLAKESDIGRSFRP